MVRRDMVYSEKVRRAGLRRGLHASGSWTGPTSQWPLLHAPRHFQSFDRKEWCRSSTCMQTMARGWRRIAEDGTVWSDAALKWRLVSATMLNLAFVIWEWVSVIWIQNLKVEPKFVMWCYLQCFIWIRAFIPSRVNFLDLYSTYIM